MNRIARTVLAGLALAAITGGSASAIPLVSGLDGNGNFTFNSLQVGDKLFVFTDCFTVAFGTTSGSCETINIAADSLGPLLGFQITTTLSAQGVGSNLDIGIAYDVFATPPNLITDAHLIISGTNSDDIFVNETLTDLLGGNGGEGSLEASGTSPSDAINVVTPTGHLEVLKDISIFAGPDGQEREFTSIRQLYSQNYQNVPEPATLSLFGAGLLALGARRRRSRISR